MGGIILGSWRIAESLRCCAHPIFPSLGEKLDSAGLEIIDNHESFRNIILSHYSPCLSIINDQTHLLATAGWSEPHLFLGRSSRLLGDVRWLVVRLVVHRMQGY